MEKISKTYTSFKTYCVHRRRDTETVLWSSQLPLALSLMIQNFRKRDRDFWREKTSFAL